MHCLLALTCYTWQDFLAMHCLLELTCYTWQYFLTLHCLLTLTCYTWQDFLAAIFLFLLLELNVKKANRATCNNGVMLNINGSLCFLHFSLISLWKKTWRATIWYFRDRTAWYDMAQSSTCGQRRDEYSSVFSQYSLEVTRRFKFASGDLYKILKMFT